MRTGTNLRLKNAAYTEVGRHIWIQWSCHILSCEIPSSHWSILPCLWYPTILCFWFHDSWTKK